MSAQDNIAIVRRVTAEFNQGNVNILDEVCDDAYIYHSPESPDWNREELKGAIGYMHTAFPDWRISLEDVFAVEDKAAYRISITGTHLGELWGVPPTGKQMTWSAILIDHFAHGKIVEEWEWMDFQVLRKELGITAIPE